MRWPTAACACARLARLADSLTRSEGGSWLLLRWPGCSTSVPNCRCPRWSRFRIPVDGEGLLAREREIRLGTRRHATRLAAGGLDTSHPCRHHLRSARIAGRPRAGGAAHASLARPQRRRRDAGSPVSRPPDPPFLLRGAGSWRSVAGQVVEFDRLAAVARAGMPALRSRITRLRRAGAYPRRAGAPCQPGTKPPWKHAGSRATYSSRSSRVTMKCSKRWAGPCTI